MTSRPQLESGTSCVTESFSHLLFQILALKFKFLRVVGKRMPRGNVRKEVGKWLAINGSPVTRNFTEAKSLFYHHKGFRKETGRIFSQLTEDGEEDAGQRCCTAASYGTMRRKEDVDRH